VKNRKLHWKEYDLPAGFGFINDKNQNKVLRRIMDD